MSLESATALSEKISDLMSKLRSLPKEQDDLFDACKTQTIQLVEDFAENPYREDLVERAGQIINDFERIDFDKSRPNDFEVGKTAAAVVAGRVRRTHFAAYAAGQYRSDPNIGDKYKNWMHNVAANGALSLHECIEDISGHLTDQSEIAKRSIQMFSFAAREDAKMFLDVSEQLDPKSCLSAYNRSKLFILSKRPDFIEYGVDTLLRISEPNGDSHIPDLKWHIDNFSCFKSRDEKIQRIIGTHAEHKLQSIHDKLEINSKKASQLLESKSSDHRPNNSNKLAIAATSVGTVVTAALYFKPEVAELLQQVLQAAMSLFETNSINEIEYVKLGDGGVPFSVRAAHVTFGDGGLPFVTV